MFYLTVCNPLITHTYFNVFINEHLNFNKLSTKFAIVSCKIVKISIG